MSSCAHSLGKDTENFDLQQKNTRKNGYRKKGATGHDVPQSSRQKKQRQLSPLTPHATTQHPQNECFRSALSRQKSCKSIQIQRKRLRDYALHGSRKSL